MVPLGERDMMFALHTLSGRSVGGLSCFDGEGLNDKEVRTLGRGQF